MNNIIGYTHLPYSKKEKWQLKINQFLKKEHFKIPNKKIPLLKTNKNSVYFYEKYHSYKGYYFNYFRHALSQFEEQKQFVFIDNEEHYWFFDANQIFNDILYYNNTYKMSTFLYIESMCNKPDIPALNFFNDLFDNVPIMDIYHILNNPKETKAKKEMVEASKTLLYLLCIELEKIRQNGSNIEQNSITQILEQESLFMLNSEYVEKLNSINYENTFSLSFKHKLVVNFCVEHYFSKLFNAQESGAISNTSAITLPKILEYGYNFIAISPSFAIQKYLDYLLSRKIYSLNYMQLGDDSLAFIHRQNYNFQHFICVDIKSQDSFFHLLEQVKEGNIELIFSKSNYSSEIFNYILTEYNISPLNETFKNAHQILFNQEGAFIIHQMNMPEFNCSNEDMEKFKYKLSNMNDEFYIQNEEQYLNNVLLDSSINISLEKISENKKRKKV